MNYFKKNKAITLLALVITIVVLVILGGTMLALALGNDGLISKVSSSTSNYAKSKMKEDTEILLAEYISERENNGTTLKNYLDSKNVQYSIDENGNIIFEKDGFFTIIDPSSLEIEGPEVITRIVKMEVNPKIVEPGDTITATIEAGENVDLDNCKYAFLKKTDEEITEDKITEDLVKKVAATDINNLNVKTLAVASTDKSTQKIEIQLDTENKIGTYGFYLLIVYKNDDEKVIRKTEVTIGTPVTNISLNETSIEIEKNEEFKLEATVSPENASLPNVIWTSEDTTIATVSDNGIVTGKGAGTTKIRATAKDGSNVYAECDVTIIFKPITSITLNQTNVSIAKGASSSKITATVLPENATNQELSWSMGSTSIATIDNGVVTGVGGGSTTLTVMAQDGSNVKATCSINVYTPVTANTQIGKLVNGYVASQAASVKWRVYYYDANYVYIISDTAQEDFNAYKNPTTTTKPTNPIWTTYCSLWNSHWYSSRTNHKSGAYLMTPNNWKKYLDSEGKAQYAFGVVPFEMYIKSVKLTHISNWNYWWQSSNGYGMTRRRYKGKLL